MKIKKFLMFLMLFLGMFTFVNAEVKVITNSAFGDNYYSEDGINFNSNAVTSGFASKILYNETGENWLIVDYVGNYYTSNNGINWTTINTSTQANPSGAVINSMGYNPDSDTMIMGGSKFDMEFFTNLGVLIIRNSDGTYTNITDSTNLGDNEQINSIVYSYDKNLWVLAGTDAIEYSTNGLNWSVADTPVDIAMLGVKYFPDIEKFIAVGNSGNIFSSVDGIYWTAINDSNVAGQLLMDVSYSSADNRYVVVGMSGFVATSDDGTTWTQRTSGTSGTLSGIEYSPSLDLFFSFITGDTMIYSEDGITWESKVFTDAQLRSIGVNTLPLVAVLGCTDSEATNYNENATEDDGSCTYPVVSSGGGNRYKIMANNVVGSSTPEPEVTIQEKPNSKVVTYGVIAGLVAIIGFLVLG